MSTQDLYERFRDHAVLPIEHRLLQRYNNPFWTDLSYPGEAVVTFWFQLLQTLDVDHAKMVEGLDKLEHLTRYFTKAEQQAYYIPNVTLTTTPKRNRYDQTGIVFDLNIAVRSLGDEDDTDEHVFVRVDTFYNDALKTIPVLLRELFLSRMGLHSCRWTDYTWYFNTRTGTLVTDHPSNLSRSIENLICSGGSVVLDRTSMAVNFRDRPEYSVVWSCRQDQTAAA